MKFKVGDFIIYLGNDYNDPHWNMPNNSISKITEINEASTFTWVKGPNNWTDLCVLTSEIKKATKAEIVTAKLLGKYID